MHVIFVKILVEVLFFNENFGVLIYKKTSISKSVCIFDYKFHNMKQIFFGLAICTIIFSACKKNADDEVVPVVPTGFQWPAGTSDYAPHTNGSTFTFEIVSGTPAVTDSFTYTVTKDTAIDGLTYRKLESSKPALAPTYYANYNAGVITNISYNVNFQNQVTVPKIKQTILKDNVPVSTTWADTLNVVVSGFGIPVYFANTLTQKDVVKNILGKDYSSVIYSKQVITISSPFGPSPAPTQIDNYFAKGIGLVQKDATGNNVKIKRYNIVK
jgi:hypothetical protein